jgi:hypothetical protein
MLAASTPDRTSAGQTFANRWRPASVRIRTVSSMTKRLPERRTALITAGGIAAVVVAGAFAVGANLGILDASSDNQIGALSAAGDLVPTTTSAAATVPTDRPTPTTAGPQTFLVDVAGTVALDASGDSLVLSAVSATPGWAWSWGPSDAMHIALTFSDGARFLVFTASRAPDGSIDAMVDETTPGTSTATVPTSHDGHDDREHDDDDDGGEHEGRDDDD